MDAKTRILKAGARIVLEKGFCDTGLAEVLEAAKVPKGSFYFHFKNKEDFGLQLVDTYAETLKAGWKKMLGMKIFPTWNESGACSDGRRNYSERTTSKAAARSATCPWKWAIAAPLSAKNWTGFFPS